MFTRDNSAFILIDVQIALARVMHNRDDLIQSLCKLVRGLKALEVPILWAEQNPKALGETIPELAQLMPGAPVDKLSFSCCGEARFKEALEQLGRRQIVLAGIETHVCVHQTAVDLIDAGYAVQVVADAVSSRTQQNKEIGLAKMMHAGAAITSVETVLFELLSVASGPEFKEILKIVK